eukprot:snap_masked-scaffold_7-processed-gene-11.13-mRNA-1 protein AED:1.00 eAED:1.00 QI:0/-1/0/0/-1/1/1/0/284
MKEEERKNVKIGMSFILLILIIAKTLSIKGLFSDEGFQLGWATKATNAQVDTGRIIPKKSFIFILSRRRSGSTELCKRISELSFCHYNMNEILNAPLDPQHGDLRDSQFFTLFNHRKSKLNLNQYVNSQADIFCSKILRRLHPSCKRCVGVAKIFDQPSFGQMSSRSKYHEQFKDLIGRNDSFSLVLERNTKEQECSLNWARESGDWGTCPGCHTGNQTSRTEFYKSCYSKETSHTFQEENDAWFTFVRSTLREQGKWYVDVSFKIHHQELQIRSLLQTINRSF